MLPLNLLNDMVKVFANTGNTLPQQSMDCESLTPTRGATQQSVDCESLTPTQTATQQSVD